MYSLIGSLPDYIPCFIRDQFMYDDQEGHGNFTEGMLFGFVSRPQHAPAFHFMTINGAQWARMPLHAFCWKPCEAQPLEELSWWDCPAYDFTVHKFDMLLNYDCDYRTRSKQVHRGSYMFTFDWDTRWASMADEHKNGHMLMLENGNFAIAPNNVCLWKDQAWIVQGAIPKYKVNTHTWSAESHLGIEDRNSRDYTKGEANEQR